jgi:ABC-type bacteriocin/lantibiotic exporter with double-glycine peptidase domain
VQRWLKISALLITLGGALFASVGPNIWLDVPFIKQEKNGCGAASIAMIMQYWQRQQSQGSDQTTDAGQIQRALYSKKAHGIYASDLTEYLVEHGFRTFAFRGEWSDLESNLTKGRPLVLALQPERGDPLHYVVVTGIDAQQDVVLMNDPAQRKLLKQDRADFEKQWKAAGNWTLLAVPQK